MSTNRTNTVRIGCAVSLLLFAAIGVILFRRYQAMTSCHGKEPLLTSFAVRIDPSQNQQLIEQSRQFAFKHSFRFDVADFERPASDVRIHMTGKGVEIITRISSQPGAYEIGFYNYDCIHPTAVSEIGDLAADLRIFMSQIPNATVTETK